MRVICVGGVAEIAKVPLLWMCDVFAFGGYYGQFVSTIFVFAARGGK